MNRSNVLAGYYGFGNFGDDLFRDILSIALRRSSVGQPIITQNNPGLFSKVTRNVRAVKNITSADSITLGGGSILGARGLLGIRQIEMIASRLCSLPYCAIGVGFLDGNLSLAQRVAPSFSWIGVRSKSEYAQISPLGGNIIYMSDLAYATKSYLISEACDSSRRDITLVPAGVGELGSRCNDQEWLKDWLIANIIKIFGRSTRIKILQLQSENQGDSVAGKKIAESAHSLGLEVVRKEHTTTEQTIKEISNSLFIFTDRLHGGIVAHLYGVPFRLSTHHRKCFEFLSDIGHPDAHCSDNMASFSNKDALSSIIRWSDLQSDNVIMHSEHACSGIHQWIKHLSEGAIKGPKIVF